MAQGLPMSPKLLIGLGLGAVGLISIAVITRSLTKDKDVPKAPKPFDFPTAGSGIPKGWTPSADARVLHTAMEGAGTDTDAIFAALQGNTKDQLVAIYNEFTRLFWDEGDGDLFAWFEDDLDSADLSRALSFFNETGL